MVINISSVQYIAVGFSLTLYCDPRLLRCTPLGNPFKYHVLVVALYL